MGLLTSDIKEAKLPFFLQKLFLIALFFLRETSWNKNDVYLFEKYLNWFMYLMQAKIEEINDANFLWILSTSVSFFIDVSFHLCFPFKFPVFFYTHKTLTLLFCVNCFIKRRLSFFFLNVSFIVVIIYLLYIYSVSKNLNRY